MQTSDVPLSTFSKTNLHLSFMHTDRKALHGFFRIVNARSGARVEFPAVQRAINVPIFGHAFTEGPAAMRTTSIERVDLPVNPEQSEFPVADADAEAAVKKNPACFGDGYKFAHIATGEFPGSGNDAPLRT
jgi:hypothetical protein